MRIGETYPRYRGESHKPERLRGKYNIFTAFFLKLKELITKPSLFFQKVHYIKISEAIIDFFIGVVILSFPITFFYLRKLSFEGIIFFGILISVFNFVTFLVFDFVFAILFFLALKSFHGIREYYEIYHTSDKSYITGYSMNIRQEPLKNAFIKMTYTSILLFLFNAISYIFLATLEIEKVEMAAIPAFFIFLGYAIFSYVWAEGNSKTLNYPFNKAYFSGMVIGILWLSIIYLIGLYPSFFVTYHITKTLLRFVS